MAEYYTIGGSLMHYRTKGSRNGVSNTPGYRAIGQRAVGRLVNGRYVYDIVGGGDLRKHDQQMVDTMAKYRNRVYKPSAGERRAAATQLRSQYDSERKLSGRTSGNTSSVAKAAYRAAYATGNGRYGRDILNADRQYQSAKGHVNAAGVKLSKAAENAYNQAIDAVKSSAKQIKDWGTKQIDWAGQQASKALSSARSFISNLLQKIGAGAKAVQKWAVNAYNQASRAVQNTARNAIYKTTGQLTMMPEWSLPQRRRGGGNMRRSTATTR